MVRPFAGVLLAVVLTLPAVASRAAPKPRVTLPAQQAVVSGDGKRAYWLELSVRPASFEATALRIRAKQGEVLEYGKIENGRLRVRYRPPAVTAKTRSVISVTVWAGKSKHWYPIRVTVVPPSAEAAAVDTEEADASAPAASGAEVSEPAHAETPTAASLRAAEGVDGSGSDVARSSGSEGGVAEASASGAAAESTLETEDGMSVRVWAVQGADGDAAAANAPLDDPTARYALWELPGIGLSHATTTSLVAMVRGELREILGERYIDGPPGFDPATRRQVAKCSSTLPCMAEVALAQQADRVIYGAFSAFGDAYSLTLKLLDARTAETLSSAKASLTGDRSELLYRVRVLLLSLILPTQLRGSVSVQMQLEGASVYLDGALVGTTPLGGPIEDVPAGEHSLKITSPEMRDYYTFVTVHHGKMSTVVLDAKRIEVLRAELDALRRSGPVVGGVTVAAKVGYSTNFGNLSAPLFLLELGAQLRIFHPNLRLLVESGVTGRSTRQTLGADAGAAAGETMTVKVWAVPITAHLVYHQPFSSGFALYGGLGGGVYVTGVRMRAPSVQPTVSTKARPAYGARFGAEMALGPGRVTAEVAYTHAPLKAPGLRGNVVGTLLAAGYRLHF